MAIAPVKILAIAAVAVFCAHSVSAGGEDLGPCSPDCQCVRPDLFTVQLEGNARPSPDCSLGFAQGDVLLQILNDNNCLVDCPTRFICRNTFAEFQIYHDGCLEDDLSLMAAQDFHDYEEVCTLCDIPPQNIPGAPDCPVVDCEDSVTGNEVFSLLEANCFNDNCTLSNELIGDSGKTCAELFYFIKFFHDECDEETVEAIAGGELEELFHDFEPFCPECNIADEVANNLIAVDCDSDNNISKGILCNVNGDDILNVQDLVAVVNTVLGSNTLTECQEESADFDENELLNVADIVSCANLILGTK